MIFLISGGSEGAGKVRGVHAEEEARED